MLGGVSQDGHLVGIDEALDVLDIARSKIGSISVRSTAPELDVIVSESLRINEAILKWVALIARRKHTQLHHHAPSPCRLHCAVEDADE